MVAKGGTKLVDDKSIEIIKAKLMNRVSLITPNIPEAEVLTNSRIITVKDIISAGKLLLKLGAKNVLIKGGHFSQGDKEKFEPLVDNLINHDPFCVFADFSDYLDAQDRVSSAWKDHERWNRMSLINTARSGFFSSDRSIRDYCKNIWGI